ncbi:MULTISPECIES: hypothetical protein [unclassified Pseudoalteromonas]|uniref:hypothetical protein n=1 Tax=unclassified Pseudoalteromonas TaxID=194690 RepID=UPI0005A98CDA|nr:MULTISPECIES: hypothetical protein [unclassified Pseudoalteromonas]
MKYLITLTLVLLSGLASAKTYVKSCNGCYDHQYKSVALDMRTVKGDEVYVSDSVNKIIKRYRISIVYIEDYIPVPTATEYSVDSDIRAKFLETISALDLMHSRIQSGPQIEGVTSIEIDEGFDVPPDTSVYDWLSNGGLQSRSYLQLRARNPIIYSYWEFYSGLINTITVGSGSTQIQVEPSAFNKPLILIFEKGGYVKVYPNKDTSSWNIVKSSAYDENGNQVPFSKESLAGHDFNFQGKASYDDFEKWAKQFNVLFTEPVNKFSSPYKVSCNYESGKFVCTLKH